MNTGGVTSEVQLTVLDAVDVLSHASIAVHVLVCVRTHPVLVTLLLLCVIVGAPHASVAVAVPNAVLISTASGLHPNGKLFPPVVITGGVTSAVHVTVLDAVDVLSHASIAVHVLV